MQNSSDLHQTWQDCSFGSQNPNKEIIFFGKRLEHLLPIWTAPPTPYKALSIGAHSFLIFQMGGAAQFGRGCSRRLPKKILFLLGFQDPKEQSYQVSCKSELFHIFIHFLLAPKELSINSSLRLGQLKKCKKCFANVFTNVY